MDNKNNHYNCIYMYTNKINGKRYIGQAKNFNKRHMEHIRKHEYIIDKAIDKYGIENFDITILEENVNNEDLLNEYERKYISEFNTLTKNEKGYNISDGGHNGNPFAGKTDEWMNEYKKIRSDQYIGNKNPFYNKKHSEESKKKMSESQKKLDNKGEKNSFYGHKHTEENKQKMSECKKGSKNPKSKAVICLNTKEIFYSMSEAQIKYNIKGKGSIGKCCLKQRETCGTHPITKEKLKWMYLDEYEKLNK